MSVEAEVAAQVIQTILKIILGGTEYSLKISGTLGKHAAARILAALSKERDTIGKTRLKNMITSGKPLSIFTIKTEDIKGFQSQAKKYGVTYNVIKGKEACDIMCTADQSIQVKKVFENLNIGVLGDADVEPPSVSPLKEETMQKEKEETFVDDVLGVTKERADKSHIQAINQIVDDEQKKENPKQALKKDPQSKPLSEQKDTGKSKKDEKPSIRTEIQKMKQMQKVRTTDINRALNKQKNSIKL